MRLVWWYKLTAKIMQHSTGMRDVGRMLFDVGVAGIVFRFSHGHTIRNLKDILLMRPDEILLLMHNSYKVFLNLGGFRTHVNKFHRLSW